MSVRRLREGSRQVLGFPRSLVLLWHREFHDSRIILEQQGDLRYFSVSAQLQRNLVRGLILLGLAGALVIAALCLASALLWAGNAKLERSHNEIYDALLGSTADLAQEGGGSVGRDEMLALAQTIRERDLEIRRFVNSSATTLPSDKKRL